MSIINLTAAESKLLNTVILEMNTMPDVNYEIVAQKVGIKYAKNAKQSFKKVWDKLKAGGNAGAATNGDEANSGDSEGADGDAEIQSPSPKKPAVKKPAAAPKKAPVVKKGVAKATGPKKASEGGPKPKRKSKKQKEEEEAAAAAAALAASKSDNEDNEDEDDDVVEEAENEDGKSPSPITAGKASSSESVGSVNPVDPLSVEPAKPDQSVLAAKSVESVFTESISADGDADTAGVIELVSIPMNDEYEAYIRQMPMDAWLEWKTSSGYTFDILNI